MSAKELKPFITQAIGALALLLAGKPILLWCLHLIEAPIMQALDAGHLDEVVSRANLAAKEAAEEAA